MNSDWHLLVIEDDPDGQEVVGRILTHYNIPYHTVGTAEEAVDLLNQYSFSALIVDLALPGADGWTLLNYVRNNPHTAHTPCIAMTAYHSTELAVKAIEAGFNAYFPKPLVTAGFVAEIGRVLNAA
jgi:CheY-like chemotaxis protein